MDLEQSTLFKELTQGKQFAEQLCKNLSSSSLHTRQLLTDQVLSSFQKALSSLNRVPPGSPMSEVSDKNQVFKKRKTSKKHGDQVKVCSSGSSSEGPVDDGFSWRKYGQKDILGSNHPRGYYRCTHRHTQGCLATKQVQRSDGDPTVFDVTYRGGHTCKPSSQLTAPLKTTAATKSFMEKNKNHVQQCEEKQKQQEDVLLSFGTDSNVKNEDSASWEDIYFFTFPSHKMEPEENHVFKESMVENRNTMCGSLSSSLMSTETSECNYFSISPPTSVTNSPFCDLDFHFGEVEFDADFPLDDPEFFC